jgi:RNA polymerase-interacting CarD/CdnL/TRCF family regulator
MRKVVSPGGATKPAATFKVGDKVVLEPKAVLTISAIGPRSKLSSEPGDEPVYALRPVGEEGEPILIDVKATTRPPLRHISTKDELTTFLAVLGDELQNSRVTPPPADLMKEVKRAGNDLVKLARLFPYLRASDNVERDTRAALDKLFVQEIAIVRGIDERDARSLLDHL